jgi:hypothetical protein
MSSRSHTSERIPADLGGAKPRSVRTGAGHRAARARAEALPGSNRQQAPRRPRWAIFPRRSSSCERSSPSFARRTARGAAQLRLESNRPANKDFSAGMGAPVGARCAREWSILHS